MSDNHDNMLIAQGDASSVTVASIKSIKYPLDKLNKIVWNSGNDSKLKIITADSGDRKAGKDVYVQYRIDFDNLDNAADIATELTSFDKRVYIAVASIYNTGNETMSLTMIHKAMGNAGSPDAKQLARINNSITKMASAHIYVDNGSEAKTYQGYKHFVYDASLLPCERVSAKINGKLTDAAIHLFREPPLMTFAKDRKHFTALPIALLISPLSKTEANLQLEDYILQEISHMQHHTSFPRKMLINTICKRCGINTRMQRSRVLAKIRTLLEFYTQQKYIAGYTQVSDGILIDLTSG